MKSVLRRSDNIAEALCLEYLKVSDNEDDIHKYWSSLLLAG